MISPKSFQKHFAKILTAVLLVSGILITGYKKPVQYKDEEILYVKNPKNGPLLGYASGSGVKILTVDGFYFKDLNKNG